MKSTKLLALILCISILFNLSSPLVRAADIESVHVENVLTGEGFAAYIYENELYRYSVFINTDTGYSSFAIMYFSNNEYVYEHCFTLDTDSICVDAVTFWNCLLSDCMSACLHQINGMKSICPLR